MKFNQIQQQMDFSKAYEALKNGVKIGSAIIKVADENISAPAKIIQETPFVNTKQLFEFQFGTSAPVGTAALHNVILGQNNAFVVVGFQVMIGYGANANNRTY